MGEGLGVGVGVGVTVRVAGGANGVRVGLGWDVEVGSGAPSVGVGVMSSPELTGVFVGVSTTLGYGVGEGVAVAPISGLDVRVGAVVPGPSVDTGVESACGGDAVGEGVGVDVGLGVTAVGMAKGIRRSSMSLVRDADVGVPEKPAISILAVSSLWASKDRVSPVTVVSPASA